MYYRTRKILSSILSGILSALIVLVSFFSIICILLNIVFIKTNVVGYSMVPTFNSTVEQNNKSGDTIFINRFKDYSLGDVVVAEMGDKYIIKRLVGCPGDTIQIKDETKFYGLYVNDELLYKKEKTNGDSEKIGSSNNYYQDYLTFLENANNIENGNVIENDNKDKCIKLNEDEYFLMGDNWGKTSDSLTGFTLFGKSEIVGKVEITVPYGESEEPFILKFMLKILFN